MAILAQEEVGIWIGNNMLCAALEWAALGGHKREAVLLMNGQFHEKKLLHLKWQKNPGLPRMITWIKWGIWTTLPMKFCAAQEQ